MARKRGPKRSRLGPSSGFSPDRLIVSAISITSPGSNSGLTPPAALVSTSVLHAQRQDGAQQQRRLAVAPALVRMGATGEHHHRGPGRAPDDQLAGVALHLGAGHIRDVAVRDSEAGLGVEQVDHAAQPGAEHERRAAAPPAQGPMPIRSANERGGLVDPALELRAVQPVGQRAPADRLHLHALQQLALLRLVLLGA